MIKQLLTFLVTIFFISNSAFALQTVKIEYIMPIDYSVMDEKAISTEADNFYKQYQESKDSAALQNMLSTYTLLTNINKDNPFYFVRVGIAYGKLKNDRFAKSYFCRGMTIIDRYPYAYAAFGDFWFERVKYRKALKNYLQANEYGYESNFDNLNKIGTCYKKLGDYKSAIRYFQSALEYNKCEPGTDPIKDAQNEELRNQIQELEALLLENPTYDEKERRIY